MKLGPINCEVTLNVCVCVGKLKSPVPEEDEEETNPQGD